MATKSNDEWLWDENAGLRELLKQQQALLEVMQQEITFFRKIALTIEESGYTLGVESLIKRIANETRIRDGIRGSQTRKEFGV